MNLLWLLPMRYRLRSTRLGREQLVPEAKTISRLQSRKEQIGAKIEGRRGRTRFGNSDQTLNAGPLADKVQQEKRHIVKTKPGLSSKQNALEHPDEAGEASYTERLLKAKKKLWYDRDQPGK
jgi:hypothetical protein